MPADLSSPSELSRHPALAERVLLIGWDAADWQVINPLLDAGKLPTLERFLNGGVMGNIATLQPILSPILWTSIATGKRSFKHGIHGFTEPAPDGSGIQPVASTSREGKAIWNILSQMGLRTQVFGWFASHPAEPLPDGICVTDAFPRISGSMDEPTPLATEAVHPERLREVLEDLRIHPHEIEGAHLQPFLPRAQKIDQTKPVHQGRLFLLQRLLAQCSSIHAAATWALEHEPWDFAAIYYEGLDLFCHGFMPFHPPRMEDVGEAEFALYRDVVTGIYRFHDLMLARLLELAGENTTVILVSDHGFYSDHLRPRNVGGKPPHPAEWHRSHGIVALRGPAILADERVYGTTLLDIAPTVLALFGLPVGADMDGRVIAQAFRDPPQVGQVPSWDSIEGPHSAGLHPPDKRLDPVAVQEAIQQLVELGYISAPTADVQATIARTILDQQMNTASSYVDAGQPEKALPLLQAIHAQQPDKISTALALAQVQLASGHLPAARATLEQVAAKMAEQSEPASAARLDLLMGVLLAAEGRDKESLQSLARAEQVQPRLPGLHNQIGNIYLRGRRWDDAERAFQRALEIDGDYAPSWNGLSVALLRQNRAADAAELSLRAVGLQHFFPSAHFQLGAVLARLGWPERAVQAFETGLQMRPGVLVVHRYLARLYARLGNSEKARFHRAASTRGPRPAANRR